MRMERNSLRSNVRAMGAGRVLPFEDDQYLSSSYILKTPAAAHSDDTLVPEITSTSIVCRLKYP